MNIVPYDQAPYEAGPVANYAAAAFAASKLAKDAYTEYRKVYGYSPTPSYAPTPGAYTSGPGGSLLPQRYSRRRSSMPYRCRYPARRYGRRAYKTGGSKPTKKPHVFARRSVTPRVEIKQNTVLVAIAAASLAGGSLYQLDSVAHGTAVNERDGDIIQRKGLTAEITYTRPSLNDFLFWRVIVFRWTQNWVAPSITSVLDAAVINSNYRINNARWYTIIKDVKWHNEASAGSAGAWNAFESFKTIFVADNKLVSYQNNAATTGDSGIWMIMFSNASAGSHTIRSSTKFIDV